HACEPTLADLSAATSLSPQRIVTVSRAMRRVKNPLSFDVSSLPNRTHTETFSNDKTDPWQHLLDSEHLFLLSHALSSLDPHRRLVQMRVQRGRGAEVGTDKQNQLQFCACAVCSCTFPKVVAMKLAVPLPDLHRPRSLRVCTLNEQILELRFGLRGSRRVPCVPVPCVPVPCVPVPCVPVPCVAVPCVAVPCVPVPCVPLPTSLSLPLSPYLSLPTSLSLPLSPYLSLPTSLSLSLTVLAPFVSAP
ncbi:unnamed protein product, partial [Closterium sp. NIES-53]